MEVKYAFTCPESLFTNEMGKVTELIEPTSGISGDPSGGGYTMSSYLRTKNPM